MNPFKGQTADRRNKHLSVKKKKGLQMFFKLIFESELFKKHFEVFVKERFLEEYLLEVPVRLLLVLSEAFYQFQRDGQVCQLNFPWTLGEVQLAFNQVKKNYF